MKEGAKEERVNAILQPKYDAMSVYHYKAGWCQALEEELEVQHPPHDDIKDALASAVDMSIPPKRARVNHKRSNVVFSSRFGGVSFG